MTAKKRSRSGPSGRSLTADERKANGRVLVQAWLSPEAGEALAWIAKSTGYTKTTAIELALIAMRRQVGDGLAAVMATRRPARSRP